MLINSSIISQAVLSGILIGGVYALVAIGLNLIFGVMGIINFAHGALLMLAMYISYWTFTLLKLDPYISLLISIPALFLIGMMMQAFVVSRVIDKSHESQILLTMGIMLFLENLALFLWSPDPRALSNYYLTGRVISFLNVSLSIPRLLAFVCALVMTAILYLFLKKTFLGKAIRATKDDIEGALTVGIKAKHIYVIAFGIGSACVGAAGTLIVPFFYTSPYVGKVFLLNAFMVIVIGGMGSLGGAMIGGLIIGVAESIGAIFMPGGLKHIISFVLFIVILMFKPSGLFGK
jgi:branched-chain amino acid transport system permease protein